MKYELVVQTFHLYTPSPKYKEPQKKHIEIADLLERLANFI